MATAKPPSGTPPWTGFAALAAACGLWGTGFVFGKIALPELSVAHMTLERFWIASLALIPMLWLERRRGSLAIARQDVALFVVTGIVGVPVEYLVQYEGLARTTVLHASLVTGGLPVLAASAAAILLGERLGAIGWIALVVSTIATAAIAVSARAANDAGAASATGDMLVLASLVASVAWVLFCQRLMRGPRSYSPMITSIYTTVFGTIALSGWVIATEGVPPVAVSARTWLAVVALGIAVTVVPTLLWNWGVARVPVSRAAVFINVQPIVGALLGIALFHDAPSAVTLIAGAAVIASAVAVTRTPAPQSHERRERRPAQEVESVPTGAP